MRMIRAPESLLPSPSRSSNPIPSPFTLKIMQESVGGEDGTYEYGVCAMQGWRTNMVSDNPFLTPFIE